MRLPALCLFISLSASLSAQNAMFVPFGQSLSEIRGWVESRDYIRKVALRNQDTLVNILSEKQKVTYFFRDEILYAIEDERFYTSAKEAERVTRTCLDYMSLNDTKVRHLPSENGVARHASLEEDRVVELVVETLPKKGGTRIYLKVTSRNHGPRMDTEELASAIMKKGV